MNRDTEQIERIIHYCDRISKYVERYGEDEEDFLENEEFQEGASFCLLQIGEAVGRLSIEVRMLNKDIEWSSIVGLRNVLAHKYEDAWMDEVWKTIIKDVPTFRDDCGSLLEILKKHTVG
jgi:uncharacterized protein with HEPN domain